MKFFFQLIIFKMSKPSTSRSQLVSPCNNITRDRSSGSRSNHPRWATKILKDWVAQNIKHAYPSDDEKRALCQETQLTLKQVNDWLINERRRNFEKYPGAVRNRKRCRESKKNAENQDPNVASGSGLNQSPPMEHQYNMILLVLTAESDREFEEYCNAEGLPRVQWVKNSVFTKSPQYTY